MASPYVGHASASSILRGTRTRQCAGRHQGKVARVGIPSLNHERVYVPEACQRWLRRLVNAVCNA